MRAFPLLVLLVACAVALFSRKAEDPAGGRPHLQRGAPPPPRAAERRDLIDADPGTWGLRHRLDDRTPSRSP